MCRRRICDARGEIVHSKRTRADLLVAARGDAAEKSAKSWIGTRATRGRAHPAIAPGRLRICIGRRRVRGGARVLRGSKSRERRASSFTL